MLKRWTIHQSYPAQLASRLALSAAWYSKLFASERTGCRACATFMVGPPRFGFQNRPFASRLAAQQHLSEVASRLRSPRSRFLEATEQHFFKIGTDLNVRSLTWRSGDSVTCFCEALNNADASKTLLPVTRKYPTPHRASAYRSLHASTRVGD